MDLGLNITIFRHTALWKKARSEQQNFIRTQDYATRRCVRLYEEADSASQNSQSSMPSVNGHHVGVVYAPPYRPFMFGRVEDKSVLYDTSSYSSRGETPTGRYRGYSNPSSMSSLQPPAGNHMYSESEEEQSDFESEHVIYDSRSIKSAVSRDNESFHTAKNSEDEDEFHMDDGGFPIDDDYSVISGVDSDFTSEDASSIDHIYYSQTDQRISDEDDRNLTSAIPPSIPYSAYLRRFKVSRSNSEYGHQSGFFHPFIPPSKPVFIPESVSSFMIEI